MSPSFGWGVLGQESNSDSRADAELPPVARFPRIELEQLFNIGERQDEIPWEPFKPGVEIHRLYGDGLSGPSTALLRFRTTGVVPLPTSIPVTSTLSCLRVRSGTRMGRRKRVLMINPPGTRHRIVSEAGCIVLAIYERHVRFLEPSPAA